MGNIVGIVSYCLRWNYMMPCLKMGENIERWSTTLGWHFVNEFLCLDIGSKLYMSMVPTEVPQDSVLERKCPQKRLEMEAHWQLLGRKQSCLGAFSWHWSRHEGICSLDGKLTPFTHVLHPDQCASLLMLLAVKEQEKVRLHLSFITMDYSQANLPR